MKIKGVNLGGWLLMEGYILGGRNISESEFKKAFSAKNGEAELAEFERLFRKNFIAKADFRNIALMGANSVRLPFNHRLLEKRPYVYDETGFEYIDEALTRAGENKLGVILDLHAAAGSQNCDWHSDSPGNALLWEKEEYRKRTYALWERIAERYKDCPSLIGYDVLNEPVMDIRRVPLLKEFYAGVIRKIRGVDKEHTIFLEGNLWAQQIDFLKGLIGDNTTISIHTYCPLDYTFNFVPCLDFPGKISGEIWSENKIRRYLETYDKFGRANKIRLYVGEFGINWRGGRFGELKWLDGILNAYDDYGFDYSYWTYKAVAGSQFPDGIYQFAGNNAYVKREGPVYGFENYIRLWKKEKNRIVDFWRTGNYTPNRQLISVLKKHFQKN